MARLEEGGFPLQRGLYVHQEHAIRKAVSGRNLVIASGTGSGKTEAFLFPILNALLQEVEAGTGREPGVRALLLYPMNALANDQVKRLRQLLEEFPRLRSDVTWARRCDERDKAEADFARRYPREPRLPNELIARDQMQERAAAHPPDELRHARVPLAPSAATAALRRSDWSALAVHRPRRGPRLQRSQRNRDRDAASARADRVLESERGRLQCFATSATLGAGEKDYPALAQFASDLFGEGFGWDTNDPHRQDVIGAVRRPLKHDSGAYVLPAHVYQKLQATYRQRNATSDMGDVLLGQCPEIPCPDTADDARSLSLEAPRQGRQCWTASRCVRTGDSRPGPRRSEGVRRWRFLTGPGGPGRPRCIGTS